MEKFRIFLLSLLVTVTSAAFSQSSIFGDGNAAMGMMQDAINNFNRSGKSNADLINCFVSLKSIDENFGSDITDPNNCFDLYKTFNQIQSMFQQRSTASVNIFNMGSMSDAMGMVGYVSDAAFIAGKYLGKAADAGHTQALAIIRSIGGYSGGCNKTPNTNSGGVIQKTCSYCGGKGWNPGSKTATYGNMSRYWCYECNEEVGASHSHDQCPSCGGTGKVTSIR